MTDPQSIVDRLTDAQKAWVLECDPNADMLASIAMWLSLEMRFLRAISIDPPLMGWTDLGLDVRNLLEKAP